MGLGLSGIALIVAGLGLIPPVPGRCAGTGSTSRPSRIRGAPARSPITLVKGLRQLPLDREPAQPAPAKQRP
jgi:hypothetical protein